MKKPRNTGGVPQGFWRYVDPDTKEVIKHPYFVQVKARAHAARVKAGLPIPWNWDEVFNQLVCESTPHGCIDIPDVPEEAAHDATISEMVKNFGASAFNWAKRGFPMVNWETFRRRSETCTGSPGVPRCSEYRPAPFGMSRCGKCGCTRLKLWLATEKCPLNKW